MDDLYDYFDGPHIAAKAAANEIERLRTCLFQMQGAAMDLTDRLKEAERERDVLRGYWQRVLRNDGESIVFNYEELERILLECVTGREGCSRE